MPKQRISLSASKGMNTSDTQHQATEAIKMINLKPTSNGLEMRNNARSMMSYTTASASVMGKVLNDLAMTEKGFRLKYNTETDALTKMTYQPFGTGVTDAYTTDFRNTYVFEKNNSTYFGTVFPDIGVLFRQNLDADVPDSDQSMGYYQYNTELNAVTWCSLAQADEYNGNPGYEYPGATPNIIDYHQTVKPVSVFDYNGHQYLYENENLCKMAYGKQKETFEVKNIKDSGFYSAVTEFGEGCTSPSIATDGTYVAIAYYNANTGHLDVAVSLCSELNFTVYDTGVNDTLYYTSVAIYNSKVYVAWNNGTNIKAAFSNLSTISWTIGTLSAIDSAVIPIQILVNSNGAYISFAYNVGNPMGIKICKAALDLGSSTDYTIITTGGSDYCDEVAICLYSTYVYLVWGDKTNNWTKLKKLNQSDLSEVDASTIESTNGSNYLSIDVVSSKIYVLSCEDGATHTLELYTSAITPYSWVKNTVYNNDSYGIGVRVSSDTVYVTYKDNYSSSPNYLSGIYSMASIDDLSSFSGDVYATDVYSYGSYYTKSSSAYNGYRFYAVNAKDSPTKEVSCFEMSTITDVINTRIEGWFAFQAGRLRYSSDLTKWSNVIGDATRVCQINNYSKDITSNLAVIAALTTNTINFRLFNFDSLLFTTPTSNSTIDMSSYGTLLDICVLYTERDDFYSASTATQSYKAALLALVYNASATEFRVYEIVLTATDDDFDDPAITLLETLDCSDSRYENISTTEACIANWKLEYDNAPVDYRESFFLVYDPDAIHMFTYIADFEQGTDMEPSEIAFYKTIDKTAFPFSYSDIKHVCIMQSPTQYRLNSNFPVAHRPFFGFLYDTDNPSAYHSGYAQSGYSATAASYYAMQLASGALTASGSYLNKEIEINIKGTLFSRIITAYQTTGLYTAATSGTRWAWLDSPLTADTSGAQYDIRKGIYLTGNKLYNVPMVSGSGNVITDTPIDSENYTTFNPLISSSSRWKYWLFYMLPPMPIDTSIHHHRLVMKYTDGDTRKDLVLAEDTGSKDAQDNALFIDRQFPAVTSVDSVVLYDASESDQTMRPRYRFKEDVSGFTTTDYSSFKPKIQDLMFFNGMSFFIDKEANALYITRGGVYCVDRTSVIAIPEPIRVVSTNYGIVVATKRDVRRYVGFDPATMIQNKILLVGIDEDNWYCVAGGKDFAVIQNRDSIYLVGADQVLDIGTPIAPYLQLDSSLERSLAIDGVTNEVWAQIKASALGSLGATSTSTITCEAAYAIFNPKTGSWRIYAYNKSSQTISLLIFSEIARKIVALIGDEICIPEIDDIKAQANGYLAEPAWDSIYAQLTTREASWNDASLQKKLQYVTMDSMTLRPYTDQANPDYMKFQVIQSFDKYNPTANVIKSVTKSSGYSYVGFGMPLDATVYTAALDVTLARTADAENPKIIIKDLYVNVMPKGRKREGGFNR